jgi:SNF2 family DNA or RNA helicase
MVWPGQGFVVAKNIVCEDCSRKPPADEIVIRRSSKAIEIKVKSFLGPDRFAEFRQASEGVNYIHESKMNVIAPENLVPVMKKLRDAGFSLLVETEVQEMIGRMQEEKRLLWEKERARFRKLEEEWASRGLALFPFQRKGAAWLLSRRGGLLLDEPGVGKTVQAIAAVPDDAPVVVVCPSVAKGVWEREFGIWRPDFQITVLSGRNSFRWPHSKEVVIVNYDILPEVNVIEDEEGIVEILPMHLDASVPPKCILVADEAQELKSYKSNRSKSARIMAEAVRDQDGQSWLLTGTPILNRPPELWNLLTIAGVEKESFGNWKQFYNLFDGKEVQVNWNGETKTEWGTPKPETADRIRRVAIRRKKKEVNAELPEKIYQTILVDIPPMVSKLCDKEYDRVKRLLEKKIMPNFDELSSVRMALAQEKIPFAISWIEMMEEKEEPVLVFSAHREPVLRVGSRLGWKSIVGGMDAKEKTEVENDFQAGKLKGVALSIKAGGVAITLTNASHELFIDRLYTPGLNEQAEDRAHRKGQKKSVLITDLVANHPLDRRIHQINLEKMGIIQASIGKM